MFKNNTCIPKDKVCDYDNIVEIGKMKKIQLKSCSIKYTCWNNAGSGNAAYLDWHHLYCHGNGIVNMFELGVYETKFDMHIVVAILLPASNSKLWFLFQLLISTSSTGLHSWFVLGPILFILQSEVSLKTTYRYYSDKKRMTGFHHIILCITPELRNDCQ